MGFLAANGESIPWRNLSEHTRAKVRRDGLRQLLHIWEVNESRHDTELYWGDELEFTMVHLDRHGMRAKIILEAPRVLQELARRELKEEWDCTLLCCKQMFLKKAKKTFLRGAEWHPEFGNHMIEATPSPPYHMSVEGLLDIEESMISRRLKLQQVLTDLYENVYASSLTSLPNFGVLTSSLADLAHRRADYVHLVAEEHQSSPEQVQSPGIKRHDRATKCEDDTDDGESPMLGEAIDPLQQFLEGSCNIIERLPNPHPRYGTLLRNVNARRGTKVSALLPVEVAEADAAAWTHSLPTVPPTRSAISVQSEVSVLPVKGFVYADSFAHGMSLCCLQTTFGCPTLDDALYLYDQMVVLAPIFLAISAATPTLFGHVSQLDTRWKVLEQTSDSRTEDELKYMPQSRYGCAPMYISNDDYLNAHEHELNDELLPYDEEAYQFLKRSVGHHAKGPKHMSERVMRHFATLWMHDPLVIFSDRIDLDIKTCADHFENIQSTNWNSVRFKPPPPTESVPSEKAGWRVELRTMDIQQSDFQNSAIAGISSILAQAILKEHWNFYMSMSQVRANMETASMRDACLHKKFHWRCHHPSPDGETARDEVLSLETIFVDYILPKLDKFVSEEWRQHRCSSEAVEQYRVYSAFIKNRVTGRIPTNASLVRKTFLPTNRMIDHHTNYQIVKQSVLAGYGREIDLTAVHSTLRNLPASMHVCGSAPVLKSLMKLLPKLPSHLPNQILLQQEIAPENPNTEQPALASPTSDRSLWSSVNPVPLD